MPTPASSAIPKPATRRAARDIIDAVVANMRAGCEPLKYSVLAPSRFTVYLHPVEFARLHEIAPLVQEEAARALTEELERMNRHSRVGRLVGRLSQRRQSPLRNPAGEWHIELVADADGELEEGDLLVDSELALPGRPELALGERTRRITTVRRGPQTITSEQTTPNAHATDPSRLLAEISYHDDAGHHVFEVRRESLTIGRGGRAFPVDLRIVSSADVSRAHVRLRRDPQTGRFQLVDLSTLGTTLDGRHVPRGYEVVDGNRRENGAETPLPDCARIGLAETVFLEFRHVRS